MKHNIAIGGLDGTAAFYLSSKIEAGNIRKEKPNTIGSVTVTARSLDSFIREIGASDVALLKVDIEGAEIEMFQRATAEAIRRCKQINVEFHDQIRYPTTSAEEGELVRKKLEDLGFKGFDLGRKGFNWLFINHSSGVPGPVLLYLSLRSRFRNVMGESVTRSMV